MADMDIDAVRAKFPQYKDMSDEQLAQGLHQKFYSDMPYEQFSQKIGLGPGPVAKTISSIPGVGEAAAAGEILTQGATGLVGKAAGGIAGLGTMVGNKIGYSDSNPADNVAATEHALTYQPRTPLAQSTEKQVGALVQPAADATVTGLGKVGHAVGGDTGENLVRTIVPAAADAAMTLLPATRALKGVSAARAAEAAAPALTEGAAKPGVGTGMDAVQTGRSAGYKFTPGAVESRNPAEALKGDVPQSFATNAADRRDINLHNQAKTTELAGQHIGKPGATSVSPADYDKARLPHFDTYKQTGQTLGSGLKGSDDFVTTLQSRLADNTQTALKGPVASQTQRILNAATSGNLAGPQMIKDISWLRANGGSSVARALEDEVQTQLGGNAQQLEKFREARTGLAQIHNLQDATTGGQVDAMDLARFDEAHPGVLTGIPKLIAQTAAAAPQDFRLPSGVKPGSSPISKPTVLGVGKAVAGYVAKKAVPSRFDVTSDAFQNRFGRTGSPTELSYIPSLGKRAEPPSKAFELAAPPGSTGVRPVQGGMDLPQGREAAPQLNLIPPEGEVGVNPRQLGMEIAQGRPAAPSIALAHPEGQLGEPPSRQLGMEIAQGRPLEDQKLQLKPTDSHLEPHQPSLIGHEGTPEGGSRAPKKGKRRGKD